MQENWNIEKGRERYNRLLSGCQHRSEVSENKQATLEGNAPAWGTPQEVLSQR